MVAHDFAFCDAGVGTEEPGRRGNEVRKEEEEEEANLEQGFLLAFQETKSRGAYSHTAHTHNTLAHSEGLSACMHVVCLAMR